MKDIPWIYKICLVLAIIMVDIHSCEMDKLKDRVDALEYKANHKYTDSVNNSHYHYDSIKRAMHTNH